MNIVSLDTVRFLKGCCAVPKLAPKGIAGIISPSTTNAGCVDV